MWCFINQSRDPPKHPGPGGLLPHVLSLSPWVDAQLPVCPSGASRTQCMADGGNVGQCWMRRGMAAGTREGEGGCRAASEGKAPWFSGVTLAAEEESHSCPSERVPSPPELEEVPPPLYPAPPQPGLFSLSECLLLVVSLPLQNAGSVPQGLGVASSGTVTPQALRNYLPNE